jgi:NAD(P)-dependent dehydrogenase (short-subunit alcohol dehydrogenase family)
MHNNSRIYVLSGSASGVRRATKDLLVSQGHRVIGVDLREADVITDLGTPAGRDPMIDQVTRKSRGKADALLAVAGVDIAGHCDQLQRCARNARRTSSLAAQVVVAGGGREPMASLPIGSHPMTRWHCNGRTLIRHALPGPGYGFR